MNSKTKLLGRNNITVVVTNENQEREFRNLCKQNGEYLGERDETSCDEKNKPLYPIYYNFQLCKDRIFIDWTLNKEIFWQTLFIDFTNFKLNLT